MCKLVVQNIHNPMDKRVLNDVKDVKSLKSFQPFKQIKVRDTIYMYHEKPFEVVRNENNYCTVMPKYKS